jgi:cell division protein FtsZ
VACLGGGTGSGAAPVIARAARETGCITVGVVTTPFSFEGKKRAQNAAAGIAALREHADCLVVLSNDSILKFAPEEESSLPGMFEAANKALFLIVKGIVGQLSAKRGGISYGKLR